MEFFFFRINKVHLARLKTDCSHMENMLAEFETKSDEAMIKKFGMQLKLDDLEETLLKNFLSIMYANVDDIHSAYRKKITSLMVSSSIIRHYHLPLRNKFRYNYRVLIRRFR